MSGAPHGVSGVRGHDLARDEPIEEHPNAGEVLLDGGSCKPALQLLNIGRHVHWLDLAQAGNGPHLAPAQERSCSPPVRKRPVY